MAIFPEDMVNSAEMSLETIAAKLTYFQVQLQLLHWQTTSFSEHKALGGLYEYLQNFKDDVVEKLQGYTNKRVKPFKLEAFTPDTSVTVVTNLATFAYNLYVWAGNQHYCDIENLAQELSGKAVKTKYLLTLK